MWFQKPSRCSVRKPVELRLPGNSPRKQTRCWFPRCWSQSKYALSHLPAAPLWLLPRRRGFEADHFHPTARRFCQSCPRAGRIPRPLESHPGILEPYSDRLFELCLWSSMCLMMAVRLAARPPMAGRSAMAWLSAPERSSLGLQPSTRSTAATPALSFSFSSSFLQAAFPWNSEF